MLDQRLKGNLDLLLLSVLERESAHGYAIIRRLADDSEGVFELPEGTVYPALHRLEKEGLIKSSWDNRSVRRRRVYSISGKGIRVLAEERRAWDTFSNGVRAVVGWSS